jgi:hypothetical protein
VLQLGTLSGLLGFLNFLLADIPGIAFATAIMLTL